MPDRKPVQVQKYEIPGTGIFLDQVKNYEHPLIPEVNDGYVFRKGLVEEVAYGLEMNTNVMLVGDSGSGKTSLVEQLAAHLNRPLRRMNMHGESDTTVLLGRDYPVTNPDGSKAMVYRRGPLAEAVERGYWFLCDEIDGALQPVVLCLRSLLEDNGVLILEDNEATIVKRHPSFRFFATANTVGIASRHRLLYSGTAQRMNEATLDRFGILIDVPYMDPPQEIDAIAKQVPDLDLDYVKAIVKIANETRKNLQDDKLSCTFSTRRCIQWAKAMTRFHPMQAAKLTVMNKLNADDFKVIEGVVQRFFGT